MIYLIGGAPRSGKTILSKRLGKTLGVSWISSDTLESVVKQYIPKEKHNIHFPKDRFRTLTEKSNDNMYNNNSPKEIAAAYIKQAEISWKAVETLVECMITDQEDLIIEGHQIHPKLMQELEERYGKDKIKSLVLIKNNIDDIVTTARQGKNENDWFIKRTANPETHFKIAQMISEYSIYLEQESTKHKTFTVSFDGNFEEQIAKALDYFLSSAKK